MAASLVGWHPDPGGARGRFRYWDGTQWSAETTDDPGRPPPGAAAPLPTPRRSRGRLAAAVLGGVVLLAVLALVVRAVLAGVSPIAIDPSPPPTVIGNDASPTPTPTPSATPTPSPTPSPTPRSPSPTPTGGVSALPCPLGLPNQRVAHPVDDRVHGGNLSFPAVASFRPAGFEPRMVFAYDVVQQQLPVSAAPAWIAQLAVGQLRAESGFVRDPRSTAESLAGCTLSGTMYDPWQPRRTDLRSEAVTVSGKEGWLIESAVTVDAPGLAFPGDRTIYLVVRDDENWGFFFGAAPIGDVGLNQILDQTVAALQAT